MAIETKEITFEQEIEYSLLDHGGYIKGNPRDYKSSDQDNAAYWSKRFDGLSMQQDTLLRDTFRELRECGYVKTQWADNVPYYLSLTVDGHNYFTNKKAAKKAERKLSRREWRIAVISAIIGGMVGLIPWICTLIGGGQ